MSSGEDSFLRLIALTGQAMRNCADQRLKRFDLTVEQLQILRQLHVDAGQPQRVLGAVADKSAANITRILDRLEKKNRIVRRPNPEDRRSSLVFLTAAGSRLLAEVSSLFEGSRSELLRGIGEERQRVAIEVLAAIKTNIEKMSNTGL